MAQFKSLARVYRPQTFSDLVGQETVVRSLSRGFESGILTQAYLFSGGRGVGKTTVARILAKAINCVQGPTASPCLSCGPCLDIAKGHSPDVLEMDGASHTSVEDVRSIREGLRYSPLSGRAKIIIIDEVHMLSSSAFNALLKTLEEPPAHVVFILATTEAHKIPDTVLSRCQHFRFRLLTVPEIYARLDQISKEEGFTLHPSVLSLLSRAAEGSLRDALSLLDQILRISGSDITPASVMELLGVTDQALEEALLSGLLQGDLPATLRVARKILDAGIDPKSQVHSIARKFLDILHSVLDGESLSSPRFGWPQESVAALPLTLSPNIFFLEQAISVLVRGEDDLRRSPQPPITFELLLARICHLHAVVPLPDLLAGLSRLSAPRSSPPDPAPVRTGPPGQTHSAPASLPSRGNFSDPVRHPSSTTPSGTPPKAVVEDPGGFSPLDLRVAADWPRALARLSHQWKSMLESARILRVEQGTLVLDTGNSFFNNRILTNRDALAQALGDAVKSTVPLRIEVVSPEQGTGPDSVPPPLVSEAMSVFGSEVIGVRKQKNTQEPPKGDQ
jgi:DNA polymerase-3 subunit gamma/tau